MAGKINSMINAIVEAKSRGNSIIASSTRTKIILKGVNVSNYNANSPDDPIVIKKLENIAKEFGVKI